MSERVHHDEFLLAGVALGAHLLRPFEVRYARLHLGLAGQRWLTETRDRRRAGGRYRRHVNFNI